MPIPAFMKKKEQGSRGKYAEKRVQEWLEEFDESHLDFDFHRYSDARAARGAAPATPADFEWFYKGTFALLEVKEIAHSFRLPKNNLKLHQVSRAKKRIWAGGEAHVVVYHTVDKLWRLVPTSFFFDKLDKPSWDIGGFATYPKVKLLMEDLILLRVK